MSSMTCREFDEVVHGFVRMELLDVPLRDAALDHAARCANCAERMAEATALAEATNAAGQVLEEQGAPKSVETAVLAAFRAHHRRAAWRRTFEWAAMGAVAATVLFFLWTATGPSREPLSPSPKKDVSSHSVQPLDAKRDANGVAPSQQEGTTQDAEVEVASAASSLAYASSDFVPVPDTEGISPDDEGMVVRVQLTRASLAELGYPLTDAPEDDLVSADVLVGEDGWPRAVRVVQ